MQTFIPHYLPDFFRQTRETITAALGELIIAKERLAGTGIPTVPKLFSYLEPIRNRLLRGGDPDNPLWRVSEALIRLLDSDTIRRFIARPDDKGARDALSEQALFVFAGLGLFTDLKPYTAGELAVIATEFDVAWLSEETLAFTFRAIMEGQAEELIPLLLLLLRARELNEEKALYDWYSVAIFTLLLHAVWQYFPSLQLDDQEYLLKNYLYRAVVAGVPARADLNEAVALAGAEAAAEAARWLKASDGNDEVAPAKTDCGKWTPLSILWSRFMAASRGNVLDGFQLEQFCQGVYAGQDGRDQFIPWLRETLAVLAALKTGRILTTAPAEAPAPALVA